MQNDFVTMTSEDGAAIGELRDRKAAVACGEEIQCVASGVLGGACEQASETFRCERKRLPGGFDDKGCTLPLDDDAAATQDATVLVVKDRHENFVAKALFVGIPVDIEEAVVAAVVSIFQNVVPVTILFAEAHVIRNDIKHLAEAYLAELTAKAFMGRRTTEFLVYAAMIDDIVAVHTVGCGLQIW